MEEVAAQIETLKQENTKLHVENQNLRQRSTDAAQIEGLKQEASLYRG